jgi:hypothetical protein
MMSEIEILKIALIFGLALVGTGIVILNIEKILNKFGVKI